MAFRDENGKITIDEVAAQNDVKNLNVAKEHLSNALNYMNQIISQSAEFSGNTAMAIEEVANQLKVQIEKMIESTDITIENINKTVGKYQLIDKSIKDTVDNFGVE